MVLKKEYEDLLHKIVKLQLFISSEEYGKLDLRERFILTRQLGIMNEYKNILLERLSLIV